MNQLPQFLLNGKHSMVISLKDRGLHYGDGVFETMPVSNGAVLLWQQHIARLVSSCRCLGIPEPDTELLKSEVAYLCGQIDQAVIKIIITRGSGGRGYMPPEKPNVSRVIALYPLPQYPSTIYNKGVMLFLCKTRYGHNPQIAGIKHLNRLEQVMARNEWTNQDFFEGLVLDIENNVIEGTMTNFFLVKDNILFTSDITQCGIDGIIRKELIEFLRSSGKDIRIKKIMLEEVKQADEVFLCNSILGIVSVHTFQASHYASFYHADFFREKMIAENKILPSL